MIISFADKKTEKIYFVGKSKRLFKGVAEYNKKEIKNAQQFAFFK